MANIDLQKLLSDPKARKRLTNFQLQEVTRQINAILASKGVIDVPPDPATFAQKYSNGAWTPAPHLAILSQWLSDAEAGRRKRILVSMPPRHGKSELISYWTPLWLLARNPKRKIILASYEADFAASWGRRIRDSITSFGDQLHLKLDETSTAANRWHLTAGGGMQTAGVGGPLTGKGADILIIDDPIKNDEEARSEVERENRWNWFQSTAFTRLEPGGFVVVVATRWHEDDLMGRIEREYASGASKFDIMKFKALAEANDPLSREVGKALWPARYDEEALKVIKSALSPYIWSSLYQQDPTPEEGNAVKRDWWKFYDAKPPDFDQVIQSWDLSFKDMDTSDYCVGQVWGRKGGQFFLLEQIRERMNAFDVINAIRHLSNRYPEATAKLIEDKANGPAVISILEREVPGIIPISPKGHKFSRLQGAIPLIAAGNVFLPRQYDGTKEKWVHELINECASFPNSTYDDQVDALSQALNFLKPSGWRSVDREERNRRIESQSNLYIPQKALVSKFFNNALKRSEKALAKRGEFRSGRRTGW